MPLRIGLALAAVLLGGCAAAPPPTDSAHVRVVYRAVPRKLQSMEKDLRTSGRLERAARQAERVAGLRHDVTVLIRSCKEGTQYLLSENRVEFCVQDFAALRDEMKDAGEKHVTDSVAADAEGILLHELAHAVIAQRNLPITGREEDAADQFAVWQAIDGLDDPDIVLSQAFDYQLGDELFEQSDDDEHGRDGQRAVNLLCWLYGSDPDDWEHLIDDDPLTEYRADQCEDEWNQLVHAWQTLLKLPVAEE